MPRRTPAYIALSDVADVRLETGAAYIYRENSQRFIPLKYSVRERDLGSTVAEAQERVAKNVPLPPGYRMEWSGEFGALQEAKKRLAVIVPLSLLLILALLYSLFNSVRDSLIALSGIPFAVAGGILGLYVAGLNLSVSAAVGFISLFGVAAMDGILLVSYIRRDLEEGMGTETAIIQAGEARMRQVFMTGFSACIGLVPAAISTGIGSQVQQPLACVIVGGMLLSPICSLLVIPTVARLLMPQVAGTSGRGPGPSPSRRRPNASKAEWNLRTASALVSHSREHSMAASTSTEIEVIRDRLADLLNEDLSREYQAIIAYVVYSEALKGAEYTDIAKQLETATAIGEIGLVGHDQQIAIGQRQRRVGAAAERRVPVAVADKLRLGRIGDIEHGKAAVAPGAVGEVAGDQRVMQRVAPALAARSAFRRRRSTCRAARTCRPHGAWSDRPCRRSPAHGR